MKKLGYIIFVFSALLIVLACLHHYAWLIRQFVVLPRPVLWVTRLPFPEGHAEGLVAHWPLVGGALGLLVSGALLARVAAKEKRRKEGSEV
ncbi:MAG: hypothetical protein QM790_18875 [Nibricoccus sp.]